MGTPSVSGVEDSFGELIYNPVTGATRIVGFDADNAYQQDLHRMDDCECECSGIVTKHDGVFYGLVTQGTALKAMKELPSDVLFDCGPISNLREQGDFTERRPWSELPRRTAED